MYQMREGLSDYLENRGYKKLIAVNELSKDGIKTLKEVVSEYTVDEETNWEMVSIDMQFFAKIFPTGWEKLYEEIKERGL